MAENGLSLYTGNPFKRDCLDWSSQVLGRRMFEIHITGDKSIIDTAKELDVKTIQLNLYRPDKTLLRTEYMTSYIHHAMTIDRCKEHVYKMVGALSQKCKIIRVKIESPYYDEYVDKSLYMESHFKSDEFKYPTSKNRGKHHWMGTAREYDKAKYQEFCDKWNRVELCLYDTFVEEDLDWMELYGRMA